MSEKIYVTKRDGRREPLNIEKIHRVLDWAAKDLDVSVSTVELQAQLQFIDGIKTSQIHDTLIKTAADLITETNPDYQYLAARLAIFQLRKRAFGRFEPPRLYDHVVKMVGLHKYDKELLQKYTKEEFELMDSFLDHERDFKFSYAGVKQLEGKYLVQDRVSGHVYESAQFLYVLIAACLFQEYPQDVRMDYVRRYYDACSLFKISLPTPIMSGVRTPTRQFSSCVLIECDDSLDSINATTSAIVKYVSQRAGIGINAGRIRGLGSSIRNGEAFHTGCIPFYKLFQAAVKSCSQGGVRGGAATVFYPLWHIEAEELLVLKNNRGVEENRIRQMDYGVQINGFLYNRLKEKGTISLFSPHDTPGLYEAFFADQEEFARLYVKYEQDETVRRKEIPATDLFAKLMQERASTGRIYIQNVDNCNTHSPFNPKLAPVRQSNLCLEVVLPTKPLNNINDTEGEIALCTLSAFNLGELDNLDELENLADLTVRALDSLLDYQNYPVEAARISNLNRRSLGIGVINYAYYLAKNNVRYTDGSANDLTHRTFEAIQYYCLKASVALAREKGPCGYFNETTYYQGILPIDTYAKTIDKVCDTQLQYNWEELRNEIMKYGLRNSTLTSLMPSETSSQISNATNGIEPPRGFMSIKQSKDGVLRQIVPDLKNLKAKYEPLWTWPDNRGYLRLVGIMQKFVDQAISTNTNYDPAKFENGKVPMQTLLNDLLLVHRLGIKTLYYHNTNDGANDRTVDDCEGGACKI